LRTNLGGIPRRSRACDSASDGRCVLAAHASESKSGAGSALRRIIGPRGAEPEEDCAYPNLRPDSGTHLARTGRLLEVRDRFRCHYGGGPGIRSSYCAAVWPQWCQDWDHRPRR
jgi:hypothetical protein